MKTKKIWVIAFCACLISCTLANPLSCDFSSKCQTAVDFIVIHDETNNFYYQEFGNRSFRYKVCDSTSLLMLHCPDYYLWEEFGDRKISNKERSIYIKKHTIRCMDIWKNFKLQKISYNRKDAVPDSNYLFIKMNVFEDSLICADITPMHATKFIQYMKVGDSIQVISEESNLGRSLHFVMKIDSNNIIRSHSTCYSNR